MSVSSAHAQVPWALESVNASAAGGAADLRAAGVPGTMPRRVGRDRDGLGRVTDQLAEHVGNHIVGRFGIEAEHTLHARGTGGRVEPRDPLAVHDARNRQHHGPANGRQLAARHQRRFGADPGGPGRSQFTRDERCHRICRDRGGHSWNTPYAGPVPGSHRLSI